MEKRSRKLPLSCLALSIAVFFPAQEDFAVEFLDGEHRCFAGQDVGIAGEFAGGHAGGQERDDVGVGQRRLAAQLQLRVGSRAVDVGVDEVFAGLGVRLEIERRLKGGFLGEIDEATRHAERAEGQGSLELFDVDRALEIRGQAGAAEFQVERRRPIGQIAADEKGIVRLGFDGQIELPVAQRRLRKGYSGLEAARGLGRGFGFAGHRNRQNIDLFEKARMRGVDRARDIRRGQRPGELHIGRGAHRHGVVAHHQHFVGLQAQVEIRLGKFCEFDRAAELELSAADFTHRRY